MSVQERRNAIISRVYTEWSLERAGSVKPDPAFATDNASQYPEGVEALSAPPNMQSDLRRRTAAALEAAGLPASW